MATTAQTKALENKALHSDNKSEGMRMLLQEGYSVQEVRDVFDAPYGFVYGVARRAGLLDGATKQREAKAESKSAKAAKPASPAKPAKPASPAKAASPASPATKATSKVAAAKAKIAPAKAAPRARVARTTRSKATAKA